MTESKAIPRITSDFHSLTDIGWYGSAYLLAKYVTCPLNSNLDFLLCTMLSNAQLFSTTHGWKDLWQVRLQGKPPLLQ
jgi:hypothetical protein